VNCGIRTSKKMGCKLTRTIRDIHLEVASKKKKLAEMRGGRGKATKRWLKRDQRSDVTKAARKGGVREKNMKLTMEDNDECHTQSQETLKADQIRKKRARGKEGKTGRVKDNIWKVTKERFCLKKSSSARVGVLEGERKVEKIWEGVNSRKDSASVWKKEGLNRRRNDRDKSGRKLNVIFARKPTHESYGDVFPNPKGAKTIKEEGERQGNLRKRIGST